MFHLNFACDLRRGQGPACQCEIRLKKRMRTNNNGIIIIIVRNKLIKTRVLDKTINNSRLLT